MRLAVDASSAVVGGGVTYLEQLLPRLAMHHGVALGPILVRPESPLSWTLKGSGDLLCLGGRFSTLRSEWKKVVNQVKPDAIYCPTEVSFMRYDAPLVLAVRNSSLDQQLSFEDGRLDRVRKAAARRLAGRCSQWADHYIAVSRYASEIAQRVLSLPASRISVVYHGAPPYSGPRAIGGEGDLLFVSTLYPHKNLHRLIKGLALVDRPWTLRVVGKPVHSRYHKDVRHLVQSLGMADKIVFVGERRGADLDAEYARSGCLLWPSYVESFGLPILEAAMRGLPVLASRTGSSEEIAGKAAAYFDQFDPSSIARVVTEFLDGRLGFGDLPREYSWDKCAEETHAVLRRIVDITSQTVGD